MSDAPRYEIQTITDMGKIPADRIDAFLADLRSCLLTAHGMTDLSDSFAKGIDPALVVTCLPERMTWIDDGANDLIDLHFEDGDSNLPTPIKGEMIPRMLDGMHHAAKHLRDNPLQP